MKYPVLLLDDDQNWLAIYSRRLLQKQYIIESTTSLLYALERLQKLPYPVIISDLRLIGFGNTGGFRLLEEAKKNNWYTKVIIITAYGGAATAIANQAFEKGAFNYLTKPVNFNELDDCITAAINYWEQEIEESISLGFLEMDYVSQLFDPPGMKTGLQPEKEINPDTARVFISYAHCDFEQVEMIARLLQKNGIPLWYDKDQIKIGDSLFSKINEGIQNSLIVLVILSKEAINSGWTEEVKAMFHRYVNNKKIKIIPVIVDDVEIPPLLANKRVLDLRTNAGEKITELIDMIKRVINT